MPGFFDWHQQKTFQCSNTHLKENQKLANLGIIRIQSQNTPQNSCKKQLIVWIILIATVRSTNTDTGTLLMLIHQQPL